MPQSIDIIIFLLYFSMLFFWHYTCFLFISKMDDCNNPASLKTLTLHASIDKRIRGGLMRFISCANCKNILKFFVPERQDNKFYHRCCTCGVVNDLALDAASSGESKPVFKVIGIHH